MLSKTKSTLMYTAGRDPLVFTAAGIRFGCALGMETHYPELFAAYEEQDVDCILFSTHGNPEVPGIFAIEAAGHAAANSLWVSYAGPAAADAPPGRRRRHDQHGLASQSMAPHRPHASRLAAGRGPPPSGSEARHPDRDVKRVSIGRGGGGGEGTR